MDWLECLGSEPIDITKRVRRVPLFAFKLARIRLEVMFDQIGINGINRIPVGHAVQSLLSLNLLTRPPKKLESDFRHESPVW